MSDLAQFNLLKKEDLYFYNDTPLHSFNHCAVYSSEHHNKKKDSLICLSEHSEANTGQLKTDMNFIKMLQTVCQIFSTFSEVQMCSIVACNSLTGFCTLSLHCQCVTILHTQDLHHTGLHTHDNWDGPSAEVGHERETVHCLHPFSSDKPGAPWCPW